MPHENVPPAGEPSFDAHLAAEKARLDQEGTVSEASRDQVARWSASEAYGDDLILHTLGQHAAEAQLSTGATDTTGEAGESTEPSFEKIHEAERARLAAEGKVAPEDQAAVARWSAAEAYGDDVMIDTLRRHAEERGQGEATNPTPTDQTPKQ
ncbi:MAG TPA: hypothetical protein VK674_06895 [Candidatus Limnocylindria bacterium]|nr:hypothetical protein [Candidatus Limnocylindria bacterium]